MEKGLLAHGLCLFGDLAYLNAIFLATPYHGTLGGSKDAYNFFHSQLRIRVECCLGMFTARWGILRKDMPKRFTVKRSIAMVMALAKLHNFCINQSDEDVPEIAANDEVNLELAGATPMEGQVRLPIQLLNVGHHHDDDTRLTLRQRQYQNARQAVNLGSMLPRDRMHEQVADANLTRPLPIVRVTQN